MQFRDLKYQYHSMKEEMDAAIAAVLETSSFISGKQVTELEEKLAEYVGVKHCISCANGTDALTLAMMAWNIGQGDAVFVPDFTFFSTGEVVSREGAVPVFVDVRKDTFNMDPASLERMIEKVKRDGRLTPRAVIPVDLFGQPAEYDSLRSIARKHGLLILEDGAQGFGGRIGEKRACSFGDIATTSFFPAKPLGCYGDGGAVFTDHDDWAELIRSIHIHGKGSFKYDNVRIGLNSRLDTLQAAVLLTKLPAFKGPELDGVNRVAQTYDRLLEDAPVVVPTVLEGYYSSWAQYSVLLENEEVRNGLQAYLKQQQIPSMIYYPKPMHRQQAFAGLDSRDEDYPNAIELCGRVLALPMHPYMSDGDLQTVTDCIKRYLTECGAGVS